MSEYPNRLNHQVPTLHQPSTWLEMMFSVGALVLLTGPWFALAANRHGQDSILVGATSPEPVLQAVVYAMACLLVLRNRQAATCAIRGSYWIWVLTAVAVCSVQWSVDPGRSAQAALGVIGCASFGLYFGIRWSAREQLSAICAAAAVLIIASVATVAFDRSLGIDVGIHAGKWRGVFVTKNTFGRVMALAAVSFLAMMWYVGTRRVVGFIGFLCASVLVYLSDSRTSMLAVLLTGALIVLLPRFKKPLSVWVLIPIVIFVVILPLLAVWLQRDALLLDRSAEDSLTGRTKLWFAVLLNVIRHPWLGYGLRGFWSGTTHEYASVWNYVGWAPPHAHNGFLDVALDLGLVGVLVVCFACIQALTNAGHALRSFSATVLERAWPIVLLTFVILVNLTESSILRSNTYWVLFAAASAYSGKQRVLAHVKSSRAHSSVGAPIGIPA